MKKHSLLVILLFTFFIHLSAQTGKKDTLNVISGKKCNTTLIDQLKIEGEKDLSKYLVLVDGEVFKNNLDSINNQSVESISVMSGFWGTNHYGKAGENGVILIKLKKDTLAKKITTKT
jgi:hypothetical protein